MNEALFLIHYALMIGCIIIATRTGKYALFGLFVLQIILANYFVLKQVPLFGLVVTPVEVYTVGSMLSLGLLQEHYGDTIANEALKMMCIALVFLGCMSLFQLAYIPSIHDTMHPHYEALLGHSPRIFFSSLLVAVSMHSLHIYLLRLTDRKCAAIPYSLRQMGLLLIIQLLDTVCFAFVALYGIMHSLGGIIAMSYAVKALTICLMTPMTGFVKKYV